MLSLKGVDVNVLQSLLKAFQKQRNAQSISFLFSVVSLVHTAHNPHKMAGHYAGMKTAAVV